MTSSSNFGGTLLDKIKNTLHPECFTELWDFHLLESSLAVLALVSDPSVIALAGPVRAGSWKAAFLTGL